MTQTNLVKFDGPDGLERDGVLAEPEGAAIAVVIHVHGKCGNFYQNPFIGEMVNRYPTRDLAFLSFNTHGHDCLAEAYRYGSLEYVGGSLESAHDDPSDLDAAIDFCGSRLPGVPIVLQGHSLGCDKVVSYARKRGSHRLPIVLLSPANSRLLQEDFSGEHLKQQAENLRSRDPGDLLWSAYGVGRPPEQGYTIPVMAQAFRTLLAHDQLELLEAAGPRLQNPALVYLGKADPLQPLDLDPWLEQLAKVIRVTQWLLLDGDHRFSGMEREVIELASDWIVKTSSEETAPNSD